VYYTYSRTQIFFTWQYSRYTATCFGPICWPFLCITHTVERNYISPSSTVGIQLHVSALYVGHFCVLHIQSNTTIFHPAVQYVYSYMFRPYMLAIFVYYTYCRTQLYFTQQYSMYTATCFGPICWPFLCITHTVEHNYISPSSTVCIQLHVSALYVGHFCVLHIQSNTTIFHPAVQ